MAYPGPGQKQRMKKERARVPSAMRSAQARVVGARPFQIAGVASRAQTSSAARRTAFPARAHPRPSTTSEPTMSAPESQTPQNRDREDGIKGRCPGT